MSSPARRYSLRSGQRQPPPADPHVAWHTDADDDDDDDEAVLDSIVVRTDDMVRPAPDTPTPAPKRGGHQASQQQTGTRADDGDEEPALVPGSVPTRRLLFPDVLSSGERARELASVQQSNFVSASALGSGLAAANMSFCGAREGALANGYAALSSGGGRWPLSEPWMVPAFPVAPAGAGGVGAAVASAADPWLVARPSGGSGFVAAGGFVPPAYLPPDGDAPNPLYNVNFPRVNSSSQQNMLAPVNPVRLGLDALGSVGQGNGFVLSTAFNPLNPYAAFLQPSAGSAPKATENAFNASPGAYTRATFEPETPAPSSNLVGALTPTKPEDFLSAFLPGSTPSAMLPHLPCHSPYSQHRFAEEPDFATTSADNNEQTFFAMPALETAPADGCIDPRLLRNIALEALPMTASDADNSPATDNTTDSNHSVEHHQAEMATTGNPASMTRVVETELDNLSIDARRDSDSDATDSPTTASARAGDSNSLGDTNTDADKEVASADSSIAPDDDGDDGDDEEDSDDEEESDDDTPMPHIPAVAPGDTYNPAVNPIASYWRPLHAADAGDNNNRPAADTRDTINMYAGPNGLPTFDTDPFLPFAPWRAHQLRPLAPEPAHRVLNVPRRFLAPLGALYPSSVFFVSRHPASAGFAARMRGSELARSVALHFPGLVRDPVGVAGQGTFSGAVDEDADAMYIVCLVQRDWPIGTVALFPRTPAARAFVTDMRESFDVLPRGQEVFYFLPCIIRNSAGGGASSGGEGGAATAAAAAAAGAAAANDDTVAGIAPATNGIWVCRAYEGRQGPQDSRLVREWIEDRGREGMVEQDPLGRAVLVRMGEAHVELERWTRVASGPGAGRGRRRRVAQPREEDFGDVDEQADIDEDAE